MKVKEFMITDVVAVESSATLRELLQTLVDHKIGGVPVIDSNQKLIGMVSDGDVIRFLKPNASRSYDFFAYIVTTASETLDRSVKEKLECSVSQVMKKKNLYAVSTDDPLEKAIDILSKHHFKKIPVISKNGELVGVISRGDVIRQLTNLFVLKKG